MKILRLSAMIFTAAFAAALGFASGCSSCNGTNINNNNNAPVIGCGPGTQLQGDVCVVSGNNSAR